MDSVMTPGEAVREGGHCFPGVHPNQGGGVTQGLTESTTTTIAPPGVSPAVEMKPHFPCSPLGLLNTQHMWEKKKKNN